MERKKEENTIMPKPGEGKSALEVTVDEHKAVGSSPPKLLEDNPGKNLADLMSDEEILQYLEESEEAIGILKKEAPGIGPQWEKVRDRDIIRMKVTLKFLEEIGRLPDKYKDFDVDSIAPDSSPSAE